MFKKFRKRSKNKSKKKEHQYLNMDFVVKRKNYKEKKKSEFLKKASIVRKQLDKIIKEKEESSKEEETLQKEKLQITNPILFQSLNQSYPHRLSWYYKDNNNNIQGPFNGIEMDQWNQEGYFGETLMIAFENFNQFIQLKEFINNKDIFYEMKLSPYKFNFNSPEFVPKKDPVAIKFFEDKIKDLIPMKEIENNLEENDQCVLQGQQEKEVLLQYPPNINPYLFNYEDKAENIIPFPPMIFPFHKIKADQNKENCMVNMSQNQKTGDYEQSFQLNQNKSFQKENLKSKPFFLNNDRVLFKIDENQYLEKYIKQK